jgi:outer membrane protein TolC
VTALDGIQLNLASFETLPPAPSRALARDDVIFHRTDLLASLARYAAAESALQLEVAKQYPDIHLGPGYTYDTGTRKIAFGLAGITLPIFDQNQGGIAQAEAKRKEEAVRTAALQDTILSDLAHALARYQDRRAAAQLFAKRLALARRQLDGQAASFAAGNTDRVALAQTRAAYQASAIARLDAVVAAQGAAGLLEDVLQRPLTFPAANDTFIQQDIAR